MDKKAERLIDMYIKLINGLVINKKIEAVWHNVSVKSIQRDIDDLRDYIFKKHGTSEIELVYDAGCKGYRLIHRDGTLLSQAEIEELKSFEKYAAR